MCLAENSEFYGKKTQKVGRFTNVREFFRCNGCNLIFLAPEQRLEKAFEKERYETHNNDIEDEGYCRFLRQLWNPLIEALPEGAVGLDYGCGPTLSMEKIAAQDGFEMESYDPIFRDQRELLESGKYDFVTCNEVVEHFYDPRRDWEQMFRLLKPGGVLGVQTGLWGGSSEEFEAWWYVNDPTHVSIYSAKTLQWIASIFSAEIIFLKQNVVLIQI